MLKLESCALIEKKALRAMMRIMTEQTRFLKGQNKMEEKDFLWNGSNV